MANQATRREMRSKATLEGDEVDPADSTILSMSERGHVAHDDRGQAQWKWASETQTPSDPNADTFDFLKAIDAWELAIEHSQKVKTLEEPPLPGGGYNPYAKPPK